MQNGYQAYQEIDADAYLTPAAPCDDDEIDPMIELAYMEREITERLLMRAEDNDVAWAVGDPYDTEHMEREQEERQLMALEDNDVGWPTEDFDDSIPDSVNPSRASSSIDDDMSSEDPSPSSVISRNDSEEFISSDTSDDDTEVLWAGYSPPWECDTNADAANALLIHACDCDATSYCDNPQFGDHCVPLKRLLRRACWASHNPRWLASGIATRIIKLLSYHSLHCDAHSTHKICNVLLCAELNHA